MAADPPAHPPDGRPVAGSDQMKGGRPEMVDLIKPDLGKLVYLALGFLVLPKLVRLVK